MSISGLSSNTSVVGRKGKLGGKLDDQTLDVGFNLLKTGAGLA